MGKADKGLGASCAERPHTAVSSTSHPRSATATVLHGYTATTEVREQVSQSATATRQSVQDSESAQVLGKLLGQLLVSSCLQDLERSGR